MQRNIDQTHLRVFYTASTAFEPAQANLMPSAPIEPVIVPAHLPAQLPIHWLVTVHFVSMDTKTVSVRGMALKNCSHVNKHAFKAISFKFCLD